MNFKCSCNQFLVPQPSTDQDIQLTCNNLWHRYTSPKSNRRNRNSLVINNQDILFYYLCYPNYGVCLVGNILEDLNHTTLYSLNKQTIATSSFIPIHTSQYSTKPINIINKLLKLKAFS